jgi:purine-nucleoside phosphorylase
MSSKYLLEEALDFQRNYEIKVHCAANYIKSCIKNDSPVWGIVLGSGLGDLSKNIENQIIIPYKEIPDFPTTSIEGHKGEMIIGSLEGISVIGLSGRKHYYEVADEPFNIGILKTVFAVNVLADLGVQNYFATNAVGGLNSSYKVGDIMIIKSHINLLPNPLLGRYHDFKRVDDKQRVWRFQPMNNAYDISLREKLKQAGKNFSDYVHEGNYLAVTGPSYETEGESVAFRDGLKADAVGMSIANEVIIARNRGMKTVGFSCITNKITKDGTNATNHEEVKSILESAKVKDRLTSIVRNFFLNN